MNKITLAQREALDVVKDMIDKLNTNVPEYGTKIMTLILGILNIDCRVEHTTIDITDITDIRDGKTLPINPEDGNGKINLDKGVHEWIKNLPTPPFYPHTPYPQQVWYNQEPEPIQTNAQENRMYATEVTCTGDKNGIVYTSNTADVRYNGDKDCITITRNPNDCVTYTGTGDTGDFIYGQTSFNDK